MVTRTEIKRFISEELPPNEHGLFKEMLNNELSIKDSRPKKESNKTNTPQDGKHTKR